MYINTMDYYSAIEKNAILLSESTQMDLGGITLNEVSQTEKDNYFMILLICEILKRMNQRKTDSQIQEKKQNW